MIKASMCGQKMTVEAFSTLIKSICNANARCMAEEKCMPLFLIHLELRGKQSHGVNPMAGMELYKPIINSLAFTFLHG